MNMPEKNKKTPTPTQAISLLDQAFVVLNDSQLTFDQKHKKIEKLDKKSEGLEHELFGDLYSALQIMAENEEDLKLMSGDG